MNKSKPTKKSTAKRRPKSRKFLLTRDNSTCEVYELWLPSCRLSFDGCMWAAGGGQEVFDEFCPKEWHRTADKSAHLKPGGGPVEIEVTIRKAV